MSLESRWELMKDPNTRSLAERLYVSDEFLPQHTVEAAHRANPRCSPRRALLIASATNLSVSTILFLFHKLNKKEEDRAVAGRKCMRCRSDEQPEVMLLCDEITDTQRCTNALHLQCCRPRLATLPGADCTWRCPMHDGSRRDRRRTTARRAGKAIVDEEIEIPEEEYQAQQNDTSDIVRAYVGLPHTESAMKRAYLHSLPIEQLLALPMCYTPESLCGQLITRRYHRNVARARMRAAEVGGRPPAQREDTAGEGEWDSASGSGRDGEGEGESPSAGSGSGRDGEGEGEAESEGATEGSDDEGEDCAKPVWTQLTQPRVGCCPVCVDVKRLAWTYHDRTRGDIAVCGRCHFFHVHNTCLF